MNEERVKQEVVSIESVVRQEPFHISHTRTAAAAAPPPPRAMVVIANAITAEALLGTIIVANFCKRMKKAT